MWQFIADNFDHNKGTITGENTTYVMCIISSETSNSEFICFSQNRKDNSSAKLLEAAKFNDNIKVYNKRSKSKFRQLVPRKISNSIRCTIQVYAI